MAEFGQVSNAVETLRVYKFRNILGQIPRAAAMQDRGVEIRNAESNQKGRKVASKDPNPFAFANIGESASSIRRSDCTRIQPFTRNDAGRNEIVLSIDFLEFGI